MAEFEGGGNVEVGKAPSAGAAAGAMLGGSLSKESLSAVKADAAALSKLAASGQFAVDPEGARKIAKAYDDMVDRLTSMRAKLEFAAQRPKLGTGPYAQRVAEFTTKAARGDDQSFEAALEALESVCKTAARAYEQAAKNYDEMDESAKQTFDSAKGKL